MKKLILLAAMVLTLGTYAASAQVTADNYDTEYVFTEAELKAFLAEQIGEAVAKVSADLIRSYEIKLAIKDSELQIRDILIADYKKQLTAWPFKSILIGGGGLIFGASVGVLVGIFAFP